MTTGDDTNLRELLRSLDRRLRPEDVADLVLNQLRPSLTAAEATTIGRAARHALARRPGAYTSMMLDFARPVGMQSQMRTAVALFPTVAAPPEPDQDDPEAVLAYLSQAEQLIGKTVGRNDFKADRLNTAEREAAGLDLSRRQYNKRFRLATRIEAKCARVRRLLDQRALTLISKSRLASELSWEEFSADVNAACFVAYYAARCSLRSEFTIEGQTRPYDEVADALFRRCVENGRTTNWFAVAHVFPDRRVLAHLTDEQQGFLLARWHGVLVRLSGYLRELYSRDGLDRRTMIVRKGNDSSTWNVMAGAWNRARESWIAFLSAMGMEEVVERMCPGKVLRLMAADVARWHRATGGGLAPDTAVWAELPLPWDVLAGDAACTREQVEACCRRHRVDPAKGGWTVARSGPRVEAFGPTPELVHGVTVGHPGLALVLRKLGWFSGK